MNYERIELWSAPGVVVIGAVFDPSETRTFTPPLIRYQFPLTPGTRWTQRLTNPDAANQLTSNISRFVQVGGYTTLSTPAGTFNAIEMRTIMSVDENNPFRFPYECNYVTWWAPEAGNMVREIKTATYRERGDSLDAVTIRAQNTTIELASFSRGK
jgi:hypothetical protein